MSESIAQDPLFDAAGPERTVDHRPLESRRSRRARLESGEIATELGDANPPLSSSVMSSEIFGAVFTRNRDAAGTERGLF